MPCNDESVLFTLTPTEMECLLGRITIAKGVTDEKWRLQTGKSNATTSHQIQVTMIHQSLTFKDVYSGAIVIPCSGNVTSRQA